MKTKNILVIGGGRGIGLSICKLLENDANIFCITRNPSEELSLLEVTTEYSDSNFSDLNIDFLPEELHGLVYCPGSINLKPFNRFTLEDFENDYKQNVLGAVSVIQKVLPKLKKANGSSVLFFSSVAAKVGMPFHSSIAASKSAIEGLSRSLAAEFASTNIRFNVISPSITDTNLASTLLNTPEKKEASAKRHPLQRIGNPDEIAKCAKFLLSSNSSWITGQIIGIDGGLGSLKV